MFLHFDLLRTKDLRHDARFIGDEGGAENAHIREPRHLLLLRLQASLVQPGVASRG